MKSTIFFLLILIAGTCPPGFSQTKLSAGGGYLGDAISHPGFVLELTYEKYQSETFSLPLRSDLGFFKTPDYNVLFLDLHKGFRTYFGSGLYLEQSIGAGLAANFFTLESIWYNDDKSGVIFRYKDGANWSFMPSVSFGAGYSFGSDERNQNAIWVRPKIYWNLGIRGIHLPYAALQIGYAYTFNTK